MKYNSIILLPNFIKVFPALFIAGLVWVGWIAAADDARAGPKSTGITLTPVTSRVLPDDPNTTLTTVVVNLAPEAKTGSHRHGGMVFVYVLEGTVRSQLNSGEIIEYRPGQSWSEPPGTVHSFMENPSQTAPARLLATLISPTGAQLTTYD
ncbi:cupin domain-containing protein [Nitrosospira lacus]|uniref:Cupin type-2 domain-containing protein n=1 Tax=Nitrosospira lacus TaxID=1288494 RepID=A0A1W6SPY8_9PROT|nr:cupin domain-containing protein [Nitrosospira lacus]ARO87859.1 cupin domain-containing protein [Nitrosospira lacus]